MLEKFEGVTPPQESKEKVDVFYHLLPNRGLEMAENLTGFEGFRKVDGVTAETEEQAKEYLREIMGRITARKSELHPRYKGDVHAQILWKEETGEIWEGHEYVGMGSQVLGREKNGLKLLIGSRYGFDGKEFVYAQDDSREKDEVRTTNEVSEPFSGAGDSNLWQELESLEWNRDEVEVIGGPYGDCLVAANDQSGINLEIDENQSWLALSVYSSQPPEEWARRLGHGSVVYKDNKKGETFVLVPR
ncbi:MAG: hypothetical protein RBS56_00335 [Candidatus Gracilibacteria bacterium]|jgi:hypothetical protein|nr:hypothetical protein [Candidatus Gracilibacteria bacterium]